MTRASQRYWGPARRRALDPAARWTSRPGSNTIPDIWQQRRPPAMAEQRVQRRLAAILAADVVGFSRLMERDEAGTLAALKARRQRCL